ncbi:MAG: putative response regulator, CheY [Verrucomicrobiales bacterium]|nr:putative response regulator, CheY [Verrucomicrobiales bacterium]MDB6130833.1 putative response regulator, CheY [Verrucomicrobiales bacterium]
MITNAVILLVEDNEDDIFLMRRALKSAGIINQLSVVEDGQQAVDYLSGINAFTDRQLHPLPAVVFLDLKLPLKMGMDVLKWIKQQPHLKSLVVVVLTSSNESIDVKEAYRLGANSYVIKPPTPEQLLDLAKAFKWYWLQFNRFLKID